MSLSSIAEVRQRIAEIDRITQNIGLPKAGAPSTPDGAFQSKLDSAQFLRQAQRVGSANGSARAGENGRLDPASLELIGIGQHKLVPSAAESFKRMRTDAAAAGVNIGVTDSYRSYDEQVALANRKGVYSQGGLAAVPGTSNHGLGIALDLDLDPKGQAWMRANGASYGFTENVPREPWHWEFLSAK